MITKQNLLKIFRKEFGTTLKVMKAFPGEKLNFAPHERSQTAKRLMSTFVFEMFLMRMYVFDENFDASGFKTYSPENLNDLVDDFDKETAQIITSLEGINESELSKSITFANKVFSADEFMTMMLFDQIHHRGQLSVYIRMAGGKVPSIYGPSADDTSTNL